MIAQQHRDEFLVSSLAHQVYCTFSIVVLHACVSTVVKETAHCIVAVVAGLICDEKINYKVCNIYTLRVTSQTSY
jgi:hypothetical protein